MSKLHEINIVSLQNSFDALTEKDNNYEVDDETGKARNDVGSIMDDSDSEEVDNIFVEDNEKAKDDLVDDARKKVEAPPKKTLRKTGGRVENDEVKGKWFTFKPEKNKLGDTYNLSWKSHPNHKCRYGKRPTCPLLAGRRFLATASAVIDCKKTKIAIGEGITRSIFRVKEGAYDYVDTSYWTTIERRKSYDLRPSKNDIGAGPPYYLEKEFKDNHVPGK
uniref:Uncharacterized protein n=1 Tax=Tanacetum cinerariifolium TaxID=118510 RepID=A0A6L2KRG6_TANCI|nr:hypothetical protein [Tanacetum cinerariifolium]